MLKYAVAEIVGKQYKITPNQQIKTNFLGDANKLNCDKVLLIADGEKLSLGNPYLKESLQFDVLSKQVSKIRVSTYKAKSNTRKTKGAKKIVSVIKLVS